MSQTLEKKPEPAAGLREKILHKLFFNKLQISKKAFDLLLRGPNPEETGEKIIRQLKESGEAIILPRHFYEKGRAEEKKIHPLAKVEILENYTKTPPIGEIKDISQYFLFRFNQYRRYLQRRMNNLTSLINIKKANNEKASVIGIVFDKKKTKKGNIILEIEDPTGTATAVITKPEVLKEAEDILPDEVIGIKGTVSNGTLFVDETIIPELPVKKEGNYAEDNSYAAFVSDIHFGSKNFLHSKFRGMCDFLNGKKSEVVPEDTQKEIVENLEYIFVAGDIVDGIGVYPGQEKELTINDIYKQYDGVANYFAKFPESAQIIICPGNHDYVRLAAPQPPIDKETAPKLHSLPNVSLISNPGTVKIKIEKQDRGIKVLLYHGTSLDTLIPASANLKDGYKHPEKAMLRLLKKRHLGPQYGSGLVPSLIERDPLTIPEDIDILNIGHTHSNGALNYRGTTLINAGTWQGTTEFQKLLGHEPTPARLPVLNLKNRQLRLFEF